MQFTRQQKGQARTLDTSWPRGCIADRANDRITLTTKMSTKQKIKQRGKGREGRKGRKEGKEGGKTGRHRRGQAERDKRQRAGEGKGERGKAGTEEKGKEGGEGEGAKGEELSSLFRQRCRHKKPNHWELGEGMGRPSFSSLLARFPYAGRRISAEIGTHRVGQCLCMCVCLKEFALCYERHPESVRTVPWLCPAGCDSAPGTAADCRGLPLACPNSVGFT